MKSDIWQIQLCFLYIVREEIAHTIKGVRTIAKKKIILMLVAAIIGGFLGLVVFQ